VDGIKITMVIVATTEIRHSEKVTTGYVMTNNGDLQKKEQVCTVQNNVF